MSDYAHCGIGKVIVEHVVITGDTALTLDALGDALHLLAAQRIKPPSRLHPMIVVGTVEDVRALRAAATELCGFWRLDRPMGCMVLTVEERPPWLPAMPSGRWWLYVPPGPGACPVCGRWRATLGTRHGAGACACDVVGPSTPRRCAHLSPFTGHDGHPVTCMAEAGHPGRHVNTSGMHGWVGWV